MKIELVYRSINQEWEYSRHMDMCSGIFTLHVPDEILELPLEPNELQEFVNTLISEACNARKLQKAIGDVAGSAFVVFPDPDGHQPKEMDTYDPEAQDFYEQHLPQVEHKPFQGFPVHTTETATT